MCLLEYTPLVSILPLSTRKGQLSHGDVDDEQKMNETHKYYI